MVNNHVSPVHPCDRSLRIHAIGVISRCSFAFFVSFVSFVVRHSWPNSCLCALCALGGNILCIPVNPLFQIREISAIRGCSFFTSFTPFMVQIFYSSARLLRSSFTLSSILSIPADPCEFSFGDTSKVVSPKSYKKTTMSPQSHFKRSLPQKTPRPHPWRRPHPTHRHFTNVISDIPPNSPSPPPIRNLFKSSGLHILFTPAKPPPGDLSFFYLATRLLD